MFSITFSWNNVILDMENIFFSLVFYFWKKNLKKWHSSTVLLNSFQLFYCDVLFLMKMLWFIMKSFFNKKMIVLFFWQLSVWLFSSSSVSQMNNWDRQLDFVLFISFVIWIRKILFDEIFWMLFNEICLLSYIIISI